MATGASTCDLAVILIDARYGVQTQTKRHSFIASLLGIKHIIVAINKMDLVQYSQQTFQSIREDYLSFVKNLDLHDIHFIPMSALDGDNVVNPSENMTWYEGQTMMELLNSIEIASDHNFEDARFPVQYVNRPNLNFRGFCGTVASGIFKQGDLITALPSGKSSTIKSIVTFDGDLPQAHAGQAVTLTLQDEIDISRGDVIIGEQVHTSFVSDTLKATLVWMTEQAMTQGRQYVVKLATRNVTGTISQVHYRIDVNTLEHHDAEGLSLNEIGHCTLTLNAPVVFDNYKLNKTTGSFIVIDRLTNVTVGAGMITGDASDEAWSAVTAQERAVRFGQNATVVTLKGANAQQTALQLERHLFNNGHLPTLLENGTESEAQALKQAGLIVISTTTISGGDHLFDTDHLSADAIYTELKAAKVLF
jgi:sulfate adenylyltransferase large subunit